MWAPWKYDVVLVQVIPEERRIWNKKFKVCCNHYECGYRRNQDYFYW